MSLLEKISNIIKGALNDAVDSAADAGRDARQIARDLKEQIQTAEQAMLDVSAEHALMAQKVAKDLEEVKRWTDAAQRSVDKSDDNLARDCLVKKADANKLLQTHQAQLEKYTPSVAQLKAHLNDLRVQLADIESRTDLIVARSEMANAQEHAATIISGIGGNNRLEEFNRLEQSVDKKEARANAATALADERSGKSLNDRVAALDSSNIDDELAALKAAKQTQ